MARQSFVPRRGMLALALFLSTPLGVAQVRAQDRDQQQDIVVTADRPISAAPLVVEHSIPLVAFDGLRAGKSGTLSIDERFLRFQGDRDEREVPLAKVRFVAVETTTKALLRGAASTLASLAPNGAGQVYSAIRPGAALLTIFYRDQQDALHAVVLLVPKASKDAITSRLGSAGLAPGDAAALRQALASAPGPELPDSPRAQRVAAADAAVGGKTLRVMLPSSDGILPPSFVAATYEALVAEAIKSGRYATVWRQGDQQDSGDGNYLSLNVTAYKKGSAALRGAIPVVGMIVGKTLIRADLTLADQNGRLLLQREVKGSKRMMGESLAASVSLAQRTMKAIDPESRS